MLNRKKIMIADFDNTMAGHGVSKTLAHRLNPRLIEEGKNYEELVIATKREVKNSCNRHTYQRQVLDYLIASDLQTAVEPSRIVVRDNDNKEHVGDMALFKSATMTYTTEIFTKLTDTVLIGVSMAQDVTGDHSTGFGYTYEQFAKPFEMDILKSIESFGGQISLRDENILQQSEGVEHSKNSQLKQVIEMLRKRHGESVHCDVGFYDDRLDLCRAAYHAFKSDELLTFTVYYVMHDEIIELAAFEKREQEKYERMIAVRSTIFSYFDPFRADVSLNVRSNAKGGQTILSVASISSIEQLYVLLNQNRSLFINGRSCSFFSKSKYEFTLQGRLTYGFITEKFNSFESLYNRLITNYVFDRYTNRMPMNAQIERWQRELKYAKISDLKRLFLQQWLGLLTEYARGYSHMFYHAREAIDGVHQMAILYDDDRFFSRIEALLNIAEIPTQLYKDTMQLANELRAEQAARREEFNDSMSILLLTSLMMFSYSNSEIGIPLMTLLVIGYQAEMLSFDVFTHRALERAETRCEMTYV